MTRLFALLLFLATAPDLFGAPVPASGDAHQSSGRAQDAAAEDAAPEDDGAE